MNSANNKRKNCQCLKSETPDVIDVFDQGVGKISVSPNFECGEIKKELIRRLLQEKIEEIKWLPGLINIYISILWEEELFSKIGSGNTTDEGLHPDDIEKIITKAEIGQPVQFGESWIVYLEVQNDSKHDDYLIRLVCLFQNKDNAKESIDILKMLIDEMQSELHTIGQRADKVVMAHLSLVLSESRDQKSILNRMANILVNHLCSDGLKIYVLRKRSSGIFIQKLFRTDYPEREPYEYPIDINYGLADWVILNNDWLIIDQPVEPTKAGNSPETGKSGKHGIVKRLARPDVGSKNDEQLNREKAMMLVPLKIQDNVAGALSIWRETGKTYTREDLNSLQFFSAQIAAGFRWRLQWEAIQEKSKMLASLGEILVSKNSNIKHVQWGFIKSIGKIAKAALSILLLVDRKAMVYYAVSAWSEDNKREFQTDGWKEFLIPFKLGDDFKNLVEDYFKNHSTFLKNDKSEYSIRDLIPFGTEAKYEGMVVLLDIKLKGHEEHFLFQEEAIARETINSFIFETRPLIISFIEAYAQRVGQNLMEELSSSSHLHDSTTDILERTADFIKKEFSCDAVLVYHQSAKGMVVSAASPKNKNVIDLPVQSNSLTHEIIQSKETKRIIDIQYFNSKQKEKPDYETLKKIASAYGWDQIRSWMCVPVQRGKKVIGLIKLLTSQSGIFFGPPYTTFLKGLTNRLGPEMHQIIQRVLLEHLTAMADTLAAIEGTNLPIVISERLSEWLHQFVRSTAQFCLVTNIETTFSKLYSVSANFDNDLAIILEQRSRNNDVDIKRPNFKHSEKSIAALPIRLSGNDNLKGHLFIIDKGPLFEPSEISAAEEAAKTLAIALDREQHRINWARMAGRFRHAVLGPVQGLTSAALSLYRMIDKMEFDNEKLKKLKNLVDVEAQSIRLWRENQRLYLSSQVQVVKRFQALRPSINLCISRFRDYLQERGIELRLNWKARPDLYFEYDKDALDIMLSNLLENARKYSFYNRAITIGVEEFDETVIIWVEDIGHPIPDWRNNILYADGTRLDWRDPLRSIQGTGLGLPMTKALVEEHGGKIFHESKPAGMPKEDDIQPHRVRFTLKIPKRGN